VESLERIGGAVMEGSMGGRAFVRSEAKGVSADGAEVEVGKKAYKVPRIFHPLTEEGSGKKGAPQHGKKYGRG